MKKFTIFFSLLLLFTFFFIGSTYAAEIEYPPLPEIQESNYHYFVYRAKDGSHSLDVYASNNSLANSKVQYAGSSAIRYENFETDFMDYKYKLVDGVWSLQTGENVEVGDFTAVRMYSETSLLYCNVDVKSTTGIFFPQTPIPTPTTPTVEMMVAEEVPKMAERIIQVMKIILLCGVGCLALLISLPLFGRVFRIFQVK